MDALSPIVTCRLLPETLAIWSSVFGSMPP
jgi:hypothetical protein